MIRGQFKKEHIKVKKATTKLKGRFIDTYVIKAIAKSTERNTEVKQMRQSVEAMSINKPFIVDDSKVEAFLETVRNSKGAKNKLLALAKENKKNVLSNK